MPFAWILFNYSSLANTLSLIITHEDSLTDFSCFGVMDTSTKLAGINPLATRGLGCTGVKQKGGDESIENETFLDWLVEVFGLVLQTKFDVLSSWMW